MSDYVGVAPSFSQFIFCLVIALTVVLEVFPAFGRFSDHTRGPQMCVCNHETQHEVPSETHAGVCETAPREEGVRLQTLRILLHGREEHSMPPGPARETQQGWSNFGMFNS